MTSTIMHPPLSWQQPPQQPLLASARSSASSYNSVSVSSTAVLWALPHMLIVLRFGVFGRKSLFKRANDVLVNAILFDVAAILVLMSPTFIGLMQKTFLPRYISFERNVAAHTTAAEYLLIWSLIHMGLYYKHYIDQSYPQQSALSADGSTSASTGCTTSLFFTSSFCLYTTGTRRRTSTSTGQWHYTATDRAYRGMRSAFGRSPIQCVVQHPSGVVELKLAKMITGIRPGQYVKVCCPSISPYQWHPITISGASGDGSLTLHFRVEGSWTRRLAERVNCDFGKDPRKSTAQKTFVVGSADALCESGTAGAAAVGGLRIVDLPQIFVDGPYSASSQNFRLHNVNILIAAGIGVTPAASVIASLKSEVGHGKGSTRAKKVYLFWAFRDIGAIEWFKDLFVSLEDDGLSSTYLRVNSTGSQRYQQKIGMYLATNTFTPHPGLRVYLGRPDINTIFQCIYVWSKAHDSGHTEVGCKVG
ncbi:hypothetical protein DL89DRAFT_284378 [Linderina pennispora]|uniref:FAD-binding FR-type domain-containing protein n=1 Tax=Linderina pennispora TaxID=61395 RepID=A0A1Y1W6S7_9FUNG|nr:uncharacterized protein DL89DRAFT_284378 [Linderina pennispora]ORX69028.1 hypothetical protein DL89DRAFT_284378 [Linderina pennispora]